MMPASKSSSTGTRNDLKHAEHVAVWDLPTRIFHWTVLCLVSTSWLSAENGYMKLHLWSGLTLLTLLLFRLAWGLLGSTTARFSNFVAGPGRVIGYLRSTIKGEKLLHAGHNPAGGWMVILLITALLLQAGTGLFANDGLHFNAPLALLVSNDVSDQLTELHGKVFNFILLLVWMHVVAVFFYLCVRGENLIRPMVTGKKHSAYLPQGHALRFTPLPVALLVIALSAGLVWWLIRS
jgi:cytochrome b